MPLYVYADLNTGKKVEILRSFSEYQSLPTREECPEFSDEEFSAAQFEKQLGEGIRVVKGASWGMGKGHWAFPLVLGLVSWLINNQLI